MLHVTGVPSICRDIRITFSLYSSYFILSIKQFYYYATCRCAFLLDIQRDTCPSLWRMPSDSPSGSSGGLIHKELVQGLQPKEDGGPLRLRRGAQPVRHGGQSAGSRVRQLTAAWRASDGGEGEKPRRRTGWEGGGWTAGSRQGGR